jgi:hypothetical protein
VENVLLKSLILLPPHFHTPNSILTKFPFSLFFPIHSPLVPPFLHFIASFLLHYLLLFRLSHIPSLDLIFLMLSYYSPLILLHHLSASIYQRCFPHSHLLCNTSSFRTSTSLFLPPAKFPASPTFHYFYISYHCPFCEITKPFDRWTGDGFFANVFPYTKQRQQACNHAAGNTNFERMQDHTANLNVK